MSEGRTVQGVVNRLEAEFSEFGAAFARGQYVFWLGSAISRDRLPDVKDLLARVIEHVRIQAASSVDAVAFIEALAKILSIAGLTGDESDSIDYGRPVGEWPLRERIVSTLARNYAQVLDVRVKGYAPDYLVWTAIDVPHTYGDPDTEPDVEHYCVALLMMEGLVPTAVTANWDGLVENALQRLSPAFRAMVRISVRAEDFRTEPRLVDLIKFHGCAVLAREDEDTYRKLLVARETQIQGWTERAENAVMRKRLEALYTDRPTLMIGLSAQDANLQTIYARASTDLPRPWPADTPALVLAEERVEEHNRRLLAATYPADFDQHETAITESAIFGSYAKPTLLGLVAFALTEKFVALTEQALSAGARTTECQVVREGLITLRNAMIQAADVADANDLGYEASLSVRREWITTFIAAFQAGLSLFRVGVHGPEYQPLSRTPAEAAILDPDYPDRPFGLLGIFLGALGEGQRNSAWTVELGDAISGGPRALHVRGSIGVANLLIFKDGQTYAKHQAAPTSTDLAADDLVVIAEAEPLRRVRSSRSIYGRTGRNRPEVFSLSDRISEAETIAGLVADFSLASGCA